MWKIRDVEFSPGNGFIVEKSFQQLVKGESSDVELWLGEGHKKRCTGVRLWFLAQKHRALCVFVAFADEPLVMIRACAVERADEIAVAAVELFYDVHAHRNLGFAAARVSSVDIGRVRSRFWQAISQTSVTTIGKGFERSDHLPDGPFCRELADSPAEMLK